MDAEWGYSKQNGPQTWACKFPEAAGSRQSPVDIPTDKTKTNDSSLKPLALQYVDNRKCNLVNTGTGWKVNCSGAGSAQEGPLVGNYTLEQFHCHWGPTEETGSEHTIDGKCFSGELHFVYYANKYITFSEAVKHSDGLAVVAVFLKVGKKHQEVQKIIDLLSNIEFKNDCTEVNNNLDISKLLPNKFNYWTYPGSLTTPPCSETVTWMVLQEPIDVSREQLAVFRQMKAYCRGGECPADDDCKGQIIYNYRPVLSLGGREVRECGGH